MPLGVRAANTALENSQQLGVLADRAHLGKRAIGAAKKAAPGIGKASIVENKKRGETLANAYTGKKLHPAIGWGVGIAGVALGAAKLATASTKLDGNDAQSFNTFGNLSIGSRTGSTAPLPMARGVAPSILAGGGVPGTADNMGATGDMVFGMHNKRHG